MMGNVWNEVRMYDDDDKKIYIDAWLTDDDNEEGVVIAEVFYEGCEVVYIDERAKTDKMAQEMIAEAKAKVKIQNSLINPSYALYKADWLRRISTERQLDAIRNLCEYDKDLGEKRDFSLALDEYIADNGYEGECYACEYEFLNCEFRDKEYMYSLFGTCQPLIELYDKYMVELESK